MKEIMSSIPQILVFLSIAAVFTIVFVVVRKTLKEMSRFGKKPATVLAFCVSTFSVVGLAQFIGLSGQAPSEGAPGETHSLLNYILLPYVALAVAVLFSQLLLVAGRTMPHDKIGSRPKEIESPAAQTELHAKKTESAEIKAKPRGRPKKQQNADSQQPTSPRDVEDKQQITDVTASAIPGRQNKEL